MSPEDKNILHPHSGPMTVGDFTPTWLRNFRSMALRDGINLRQGGISVLHAPDCVLQQTGAITIEARDRLSNWRPLNLPNNQCLFATVTDRDAVFAMLQGQREIPIDAP